MKKFMYVCMYVCMYILFATSLYAQQGHGRQRRVAPNQCDVKAMLQSATHSGWEKTACLRAAATYLKKKSASQKKPYMAVVNEAAKRCLRKYDNLAKTSNTKIADAFMDAYNEFVRAWNPEHPTWCYNPQEGYHQCREGEEKNGQVTVGKTSLEASVSKKVEKQQSNQTRLLSNLTQAEYAELVKNAPKGMMMPANFKRLAEKVQRATANHEDLSKFIETVVQGSSDPKNVRYVPTEVVNLAFMQYAANLKANESEKLIKYTDEKYPARVRYSAASAAAEYAYDSVMQNGLKKINRDPAGHLRLDDQKQERQKILEVFEDTYYSLDQDDLSLRLFFKILKLRAARIFDNPSWLPDLDKSASPAGQTKQAGTMVLSLPLAWQVATRIGLSAEWMAGTVSEGLSLAAEGLSIAEGAVVELAPMTATATGGAVLAGGVVYCFGAALNDAYTPMWKQQWINQLDATLATHTKTIDTVELEEVVVEGKAVLGEYSERLPINDTETMQAALAQGIGATAWIKALTSERTDAKVKEKLKDASQCMHFYQPLKKHGAFPMSVQALELSNFIMIGDCLPVGSGKYTCPTRTHWETVKKACTVDGVLEPLSDMCDKEIQELKTIWSQQESFWVQVPTKKGMEDIHNNLYVRAIYRDGKWIPNAEFVIPGQVYVGKMMQFVKMWLENDIPAVLGAADPATAIGTTERILNGKFDPKTLKNDVNLRHGIHENFQSRQNLRHFHMEKRCSYTPSTKQEYYEECDYRAGNAANLTGTEQYVCNLAFYYCTMDGNLAACATEMTRMNLLKGW